MTADEAFEQARRMIAEAIETGADTLRDFPKELAALPEEIGQATALRTLNINGTQVIDLSPLAGMDGLTALYAHDTSIADLAPLEGLSELKILQLSNTLVSEIDALRGATGLQGLWLNNTQVSELDALRGASGLERLSLDNTQVSEIDALRGATGLRVLSLDNTQVSEIDALRGASGLRELYLDNTQVSEIDALRGAFGLRELYLDNTQVSEIDALRGASGLQVLSLNNTPVSEIDALRGASGLERLYLDNTQVSEIDALRGATGLERLYLNNTQVSEIDALSGLGSLNLLWLTGLQVADLRPIKDLPIGKGGFPDPLRFENTPAVTLDPALKRLSELGDGKARAKETLAYLQGLDVWPPEASGPPQDRPIGARFGLGADGRLVLDSPSLGDQDDEQSELQQDCREKVRTVIEAVGGSNEYAALRRASERYQALMDREAHQIRAQRLFSTGTTLKGWWQRHQQADAEGRVNDVLPPVIAAALDDLVKTLGLYEMGHPGIEEVLRKVRTSLSEDWAIRSEEAAVALAEPLAEADEAANEDARAEFESGLLTVAEPDSPARAEGRVVLVVSVGNALLTLAHWARRSVLGAGKYGMAVGGGATLGQTTGALVLELWPQIAAFAQPYWGGVPPWLELVRTEILRRAERNTPTTNPSAPKGRI